MERLLKYKESIIRFIDDRACLDNIDENIKHIVMDYISKSDFILPILFLTITNNHNKKNHVIIQGYYQAISIELIYILHLIIEDKTNIVEIYDLSTYYQLISYLTISSNKLLWSGLLNIRNTSNNLYFSALHNSISAYNQCVSYDNLLSNSNLKVSDEVWQNDLEKWYIKDAELELLEEFKKFKQVTKGSYLKYISLKIGSIVNMVIHFGYTFGGSHVNHKANEKIKKISKLFTNLFVLSYDFDYIDKDMLDKNTVSTNYIINYGLQDAYELYMESKSKLIEELLLLNMYTITLEEIIEFIDYKIDSVISRTSPDLKSNYSVLTS